MDIRVKSILRHPVKGLTSEPVGEVRLTPGKGIQNDRRFALALSSAAKEMASTAWMPKSNFLMLQKYERLAQLETQFNDETETLRVLRGSHQVASGRLTDRIGCSAIEDFFSAFMRDNIQGQPKLVETTGYHILSDHPSPVISVLNLSSVKDLERITKEAIDPLRFRANIWLEGMPPWLEFEWIKKRIKIGSVSFSITDRISRCAAINVNPKTGLRDQNLVKALQMGYEHTDLGIYMRVESSGAIKPGDLISVPN